GRRLRAGDPVRFHRGERDRRLRSAGDDARNFPRHRRHAAAAAHSRRPAGQGADLHRPQTQGRRGEGGGVDQSPGAGGPGPGEGGGGRGDHRPLEKGLTEICKRFPGEYWRELDARRECPDKFVNELTEAGYLAALIPQEYGGAGLPIRDGALILETVHANGGSASACHAQMYIMGTVLRHGSEAQKRKYLPKIATGELRLQAFGVTEPDAGSDTTQLKTTAVRTGDRYVVNDRKMFISRAMQSDLMLLLARTTPADQVKRRTDGLSVFLVDIRNIKGLEIRPLRMMMNHSTNALFFDDMEIPADSLVGEEGKGFSYILSGMNAERVLVASESIGDGRWFTEKAVAYSGGRVIFGKPIGANQGVQFPIARAHMNVEAAALM